MNKISIFLTITVLHFSCTLLSAQENPFMEMAGKKYAEYSEDLYNQHLVLKRLDTLEAQQFIRQIEEVVKKTGSTEWKLHLNHFELELFHKKQTLYGNHLYSVDEFLKKAWKLLEKAKKENLPQLELLLRQYIIDYNIDNFQNYEFAFEQYAIQEERLREISSEEVPEKALYYQKIADTYMFFTDYPKAISYYKMILKEQDNIRSQHTKQHARNGLGLCYLRGYNDYERSDSCFNALKNRVFQPEDNGRTEIWNGIAEGNLGDNLVLRGEYDKAIPLLQSSLSIMSKYGDYAYASGTAATLAGIYLKKGKISEAKHLIDLATDYYKKSQRETQLVSIYEIISKYYAAVGNEKLCVDYMDSMLAAKKQYDNKFNAILLLRMEQKELAQQQRELEQEKESRRAAQFRVVILSVGIVFITGLLGLLSLFYYKKRAAYRALVRKSREWAQSSVEYAGRDVARHISTIDQQLFEQLQQLLQEEYLYRDAAITIDKLSQIMKVNRTYISRAINQCTGKNFSTFINEYRIKEAILIMSEDAEKYSFEGLGYEVGFNDRKTFYNAFKKITGLSPSDFRGNLGAV